MTRLLTLLMIVVLVMAHGSSVAAAICRHQDGGAHIAALESEDAAISAAAFGEETAAKAARGKGAPADSGAVHSPSDMLPAPALPVPFEVREASDRNPADSPILVGASIRPLLEPPSA
jgi:hypothetical protein